MPPPISSSGGAPTSWSTGVKPSASGRQGGVEGGVADAERVGADAAVACLEAGEGVAGLQRRCGIDVAEQRVQVDVAERRHQGVGDGVAPPAVPGIAV